MFPINAGVSERMALPTTTFIFQTDVVRFVEPVKTKGRHVYGDQRRSDLVRKPAPAFERELKLANAICDRHVELPDGFRSQTSGHRQCDDEAENASQPRRHRLRISLIRRCTVAFSRKISHEFELGHEQRHPGIGAARLPLVFLEPGASRQDPAARVTRYVRRA